MEKQYYAHVKQDDVTGKLQYQTVAEHLHGTAELCKRFAADFDAAADGEFVGSTHDTGKCTDAFQDRLLRNGRKVDHATAGAILCGQRGQTFSALCVAGHHSGLQNFGNPKLDRAGDPTFCGRIKKGTAEHYLERCGSSGITLPDSTPAGPAAKDKLGISSWIRMLYSCLVDADFLDTEQFMSGSRGRGQYDSLETLLQRLQAHIAPWQSPTSDLNRLRCQMLNACIQGADRPRGIYTLTVPTGGGKTVASLAFALHHAVKHGMRRVVYVVPYTSIIEQNAAVFRSILGDRNVLEHHSGVQFDLSDGAPPEEIQKSLATENWDMPVVVTTAVQFFESLYANRSSKCRKLHNLANSVIIFDEAQMLPLAHLRPCVAAMGALAEQFRSTVVLCTATQPSLNDLMRQYAPSCSITELCPQTPELSRRFCRVSFRQADVLTDDALAEQLAAHSQVLCIVNSRKAAQSIFSKLPATGSYHLSTLMVPAQRGKLLDEIRERLKNDITCRVVSTSLIEAGVDVDFPAVYRELAGLDSILQAAGRCNREGIHSAKESIVTIFERTDLPPRLFRPMIGATRETLAANSDLSDPKTMTMYFQSLRGLSDQKLDQYNVIQSFEKGIEGCDFPFKTVAETFHLIDRNTYTVYVPYDEAGAALLQQLQEGKRSRDLYRKLGRYSVSVYEQHFQALYAAGALLTAREIPALDEDSAILQDMDLYNESLGLSLEAETGKAEFI